MKRSLRVLIVEDNPSDAELVVRELRRAGFEPEWERVDTEAEYLDRLRPDLEVILSDYDMPQFGGPRALELLQERGLDVPFIIISGTIGEETAVEVMKLGATDYMLKDRLTRLGQAVTHALEKKGLRDERQQMQQQLLLQSTAMETAGNAIVITDRHGTILWVNPAFVALTGYAAEEALGKTPRILKSGQHDQAFYRHLWKTILAGQTWRGEFTNRRKDGSLFHDAHTVAPVRAADGKVTHFIGIMNDVTERKKSEEEFRLFRMLVDQSSDTFEVIEPETGRFLDVNEKGLAELGCTRAEYLALRVCDIDPMVKESDWLPLVEKIRAAGAVRGEGRHRRKDGTTFPIEFNARWVHFDRDYIVTAVRDITERQRAEDVLRESERRFREMLENIELIAMTLDKNGTVTFCNDYLLETTGWSREEVIGADWLSKFVPGQPELKQLFFDSIAAGKIPAHHENPIKTREGQFRDIVWNNTMLRDAAGNASGTASIGVDVTERKRVQAELRAANERYARQEEALISLTRTAAASSGGVSEILQEIAEVAAQTLDVGRVSIWRYEREQKDIVCTALYEKAEHRHSAGTVLKEVDYPAYFRALKEADVIVAHDAHRDPRTAEFSPGYLTPLGIGAMLDAPIQVAWVMTGVLWWDPLESTCRHASLSIL